MNAATAAGTRCCQGAPVAIRRRTSVAEPVCSLSLIHIWDIQFKNAEVHAQAGEQFGPAGRLGGKMQHC